VKNGLYCKDFSYLGRPIRDVVYIDFTDEIVPYHKENTIVLPEWNGDGEDRQLYDLIPFLESKFYLLINTFRSCTKANGCQRGVEEVR
jgi:TFIIF-interacting CTD phosphatase-like protein